MRAAWLVAGRELRAFFLSPVAYTVLTVWLLWCGMHFYVLAVHFSQYAFESPSMHPLSAFFGGTTLFFMPLLVFVPVMTMRLLAEERQSGTLESLLTAPLSEWAIILGKYIAALTMWGVMWVPTLLYVWLASAHGYVDPGEVAASYVGVLGIGIYYMAIGLMMSAGAKTQIGAALLTFMALGLLFVIGMGEFLFDDELRRELCAYISVWGQMDTFSKGIIDTRYLVLNFSLAVVSLVLATHRLSLRKWST
ncbi:MAG: ABC transporter permease subunit [Myxococcales bacterium]|nr:ABC transporter permease subunit [Myxococcales bacterium]MCB9709486.1 ABC transporter permease subunit [Myxococcales bacterium]